MKKIVSLIMLLLLVVTGFPSMCFADEVADETQNIFIYQDGNDISSQEIDLGALAGKTKLYAYDKQKKDISGEVTWTSSVGSLTIGKTGELEADKAPVNQSATVTATDESGNSVSITVNFVKFTLDASKCNGSVNDEYGAPYLVVDYDEFPAGLGINIYNVFDQNIEKLYKYIKDNVKITSTNENVLPASNCSWYDNPTGGLFWDLVATGEGKTQIGLSIEDQYLSWSYSIDAETRNGIKLSKMRLAMDPGEEGEITATVHPSTEPQEVQFESSDPQVAEVDSNGKITAKKNGKAKITVKQVEGKNYEATCSVTVLQAGLYLIDGGFDNLGKISKYTYIDPNKGLQLTEAAPVFIRYCTKTDVSGHTTSIWQSQNTGVFKIQDIYDNVVQEIGTLTPAGNGQAQLRALWKGRDENDTLVTKEKAACKVTVDVASFKDATDGVRQDYAKQGMSQTKLEMTGMNISTNAANGFEYENYINSLVEKNNASFAFTVTSSSGDGGVKPDDYVKQWMLDHIKLYTKDKSKVIASFADGNLILDSTETNEKKNPTSVKFTVKKNALDYDTEYVLVFDNQFRLAHLIGKDASFYFKTKPFIKAESMTLNTTNARIAVNGTLELKATFKPKDANDTDLTWTSSDPAIAKVDKAGNVTGVKAGTATIKAKNENGVSAQCKITVDPMKVAATRITAKTDTYNTAKIRWNKVIGVTGYAVYGATSKNGKYVKLGQTKGLSYQDKGLDTGKRKYYKVKTYTQANGTNYYSVYSNLASVKPILKSPTKVKAKASWNKVKVSYKQVSGANGYVIYKASKKSGDYKKAATVKGGKTLTYVDKGVKTGKTYYYKVKAYRNVHGKKTYSKSSKAKGDKTALGASTLTAKATKSGVKAKWNKVSGANRYQLYKSSKQKGSYLLMRQTTKTNFTDRKVTAGKTYYYKLRAYRVVDGKKVYNKYTKVIKVKAK